MNTAPKDGTKIEVKYVFSSGAFYTLHVWWDKNGSWHYPWKNEDGTHRDDKMEGWRPLVAAHLAPAPTVPDAKAKAADAINRAYVDQLAESERLRDALALILPMAKGYATAHPVGNNCAFVAQAAELLESAPPSLPTSEPLLAEHRVIHVGGGQFDGGAVNWNPGEAPTAELRSQQVLNSLYELPWGQMDLDGLRKFVAGIRDTLTATTAPAQPDTLIREAPVGLRDIAVEFFDLLLSQRLDIMRKLGFSKVQNGHTDFAHSRDFVVWCKDQGKITLLAKAMVEAKALERLAAAHVAAQAPSGFSDAQHDLAYSAGITAGMNTVLGALKTQWHLENPNSGVFSDAGYEAIKSLDHANRARKAEAMAVHKAQPDHQWDIKWGHTVCMKCGIIQRADGQNKPCKGPAKIDLREALPVADVRGMVEALEQLVGACERTVFSHNPDNVKVIPGSVKNLRAQDIYSLSKSVEEAKTALAEARHAMGGEPS